MPYQFDGVAAYQGGDPSDLIAGSAYHASPDTGYVRITNNGSSTFTGTVGFNAVSPCTGDVSQAYPVTLNPGDQVSVEVNSESSNSGGFNGTTCGDTTTPQNGAQFEMKGTVTLGSGSQPVDLTIYDKDIHSGLPQTNPFGMTLDNYILQGGDPYGRDTNDSYEESQTPGVFQFPPVSNPSFIAGEVEVGGAPTAGAHVQACPTSGGECIVAPLVTNSGGGFAIEVPAGTYSVTALAPTSFEHQSSQTVGPVTVPPSVTNVVVNFSTNALPAGSSFNGYGPGQVPTVFWGAPSTLTVPGCSGGYGVVYVRSTNTVTGQPETHVFPMTETPPGSGTYVATVPALAPLHGGASAKPLIACPGQTQLLPDGGDPGGGTTVFVTGSSFTGATSVMFGSNPAQSFTVLSDNVISVVSPAGTGTVPVVVSTPSGNQTAGNFTYFGVSSISTDSGPAGGGTDVTISGQGFTNVQGVVFGVIPASSFTVVSPSEIQAVAPPGVGTIDVQVMNGFAASQLMPSDFFTYQGGPSLASPVNEGTGPDAPAILASQIASDSPDLSNSPIPGLNQLPGFVQDQLTGLTGAGPIGVLTQVFVTAAVAGGAGALCLLGGCEAALAAVAISGLAVGLGFLAYDLGVRFCFTDCPPGNFFGFYIDPSGNVVDTSGNPINGATATLLGQGPSGFAAVDPSSGAIDPAQNPETTGSDGAFEWEALAGTYEVQATAPSCHAPGSPSQPNVTTAPFAIPPPAVGLLLKLECAGSRPPTPAITGVSAGIGPSTGGNRVEIMGKGLADASAVHFGKVPATSVTPISPFAVAAVAPAGSSTVDVTVTTPGGTSATSGADRYTYVPLPASPNAPAVSSVTPGSGPVWGGTRVAIKGSHLDDAFAVSFGGVPAVQVTDVSATEVDAVTPASLTTGPVDVTVTGPAGTSAINGSDVFLYTSGTVNREPTTVTLSFSPSAPVFGLPETITASVGATAPGTRTPTGLVRFYEDGSLVAKGRLSGGSASISALLQPGTRRIKAVYTGDRKFTGSSTAASKSVGCTTVLSGKRLTGSISVSSGNSLCLLSKDVIEGAIKVRAGGSLFVAGGSSVSGAISARGAAAVTVCASTVTGGASIRHSAGFVLLGDATDDMQPSCRSDTFGGSLHLSGNNAGVELGGSTIKGSVTLKNTAIASPPPFASIAEDLVAPELESNVITESLYCSGNSPAPINDGHPNSVKGAESRQCSGL